MSHEYARARVREALEQSGGNYMQAQRLLLSWLEKDVDLLMSLAGPHLPSLISYAIGHELADEAARNEDGKPAAGTIIKGKTAEKKSVVKQIEKDIDEFGKSLLSSLKGGPRFGEEQPRGTVSRPGKASQKHIDAMRTIATASAAKGRAKKTTAKSPADVLKKGKKKDD
ncbi:MAG: hypothetical protein GC185_05925 [Alphaproteobacteria bacterium]|nr:hypothetical protein [Alphaproteobacteria bacterium]